MPSCEVSKGIRNVSLRSTSGYENAKQSFASGKETERLKLLNVRLRLSSGDGNTWHSQATGKPTRDQKVVILKRAERQSPRLSSPRGRNDKAQNFHPREGGTTKPKTFIPEREERPSWGSRFSYQKLDSLLALCALWNDKNWHERAPWSEKISMNVLYGAKELA
ncbi:hypothetical protein EGH82_04110 [Vibrio ponticus]|uniref:Uncharacterized protein n=1 Tax=Vibrio ponticus TaxID=265668 RepID=A0A3N3E572_9VIBR|nr:hypothetical protein EGH82_04110 [Vibrio ponticus]